jgi:uncharacterized protein YjbI with pentapeptide repeats
VASILGLAAAAVAIASPARAAEPEQGASATAPAPAEPFVHVHVELRREGDGATVTGTVDWDHDAAGRAPDYMTEGDLRLLAVSEDGHHPKLLAADTYARIAADPSQKVSFQIGRDDADAIRPGNRVVLTASQHGSVPVGGARTERTYVTVDQLQPFGAKQDRIGRRDCAGEAITPGAKLNECDLTGADLDNALVSRREPEKRVSRMLLADLTGVTARGADLEGLSVAGGRLNGADVSKADLTNVSLAGAEATGLDARGAASDPKEGTGGGNFFDTNLAGANFHDAVLNGVSLNHADLDGSDFGDAVWTSVDASTASFRDADLRDLRNPNQAISRVPFADFTGADLRGAALTPLDLTWAYLCRTAMPDGSAEAREDRDCKAKEEKRPEPAADPAVVVDGSLKRGEGEATVRATIHWDAGETARLSVGDLRLVAVDGKTDVPTPLASQTIKGVPATSTYEVTISNGALLEAMRHGNRVVLTATQHPPLPESKTARTKRSYVAVDTLQVGPGRGRVGSRDCSGLPLTSEPEAGVSYAFCDLVGAVLPQASLAGPMQDVDLTGADLTNANLGGVTFDGAAMGGATVSGAELGGASLIAVTAPRLNARKTRIDSVQLRADDLDDANFEASVIGESTFAASTLRRANFHEADFVHVDLGLTNLAGAHLDGVDAGSPGQDNPNSLFLDDLTGATLADSTWADDEEGNRPWTWATLCRTAMPPGVDGGDRDCPR